MNRITMVLISGVWLAGCGDAAISFDSESSGSAEIESKDTPTATELACSDLSGGLFGVHQFHRMTDYVDDDIFPGNIGAPPIPLGCQAWVSNCGVEFEDDNDDFNLTESEVICAGAASALTAQLLDAQVENGQTPDVTLVEVCNTLNVPPNMIPDPEPAPPMPTFIGNEPVGGLICEPDAGNGNNTAITCGHTMLSRRMDYAQYTVALNHEPTAPIYPYSIQPPDIVRWVDFVFHPDGVGNGPNPTDTAASLLWVPILVALHDQTSPAAIAFKNDHGTGFASILGVGYEVRGLQGAVDCFESSLDNPADPYAWPVGLMDGLTLQVPTMVEYRQNMEMRFWYAGTTPPAQGVVSQSPWVADAQNNLSQSGAFPWRFIDGMALIDPMPAWGTLNYTPGELSGDLLVEGAGDIMMFQGGHLKLKYMVDRMHDIVEQATTLSDDAAPIYVPEFNE